jgi:hypothetical protein
MGSVEFYVPEGKKKLFIALPIGKGGESRRQASIADVRANMQAWREFEDSQMPEVNAKGKSVKGAEFGPHAGLVADMNAELEKD